MSEVNETLILSANDCVTRRCDMVNIAVTRLNYGLFFPLALSHRDLLYAWKLRRSSEAVVDGEGLYMTV